jgi:hypothetical protein
MWNKSCVRIKRTLKPNYYLRLPYGMPFHQSMPTMAAAIAATLAVSAIPALCANDDPARAARERANRARAEDKAKWSNFSNLHNRGGRQRVFAAPGFNIYPQFSASNSALFSGGYHPGSIYSFPAASSSGVTQYQYGSSSGSSGGGTGLNSPHFTAGPNPAYAPSFGSSSGSGRCFGYKCGTGRVSNSMGTGSNSFTIKSPGGFQYGSESSSQSWLGRGWRNPWNLNLPNGARALKKVTVWEAPYASDKQFKQAIHTSEIDNGPDDPATIALILDAAKFYVKTKQFEKAEPMINRLQKLGVSNAETSSLQSAVSAGLRPSKLRPGLTPSTGICGSGRPVQIQPPSSFDQILPSRYR